jgi:hypothetical protein
MVEWPEHPIAAIFRSGGPDPFSGTGAGGITSAAKPSADSNSTSKRPAINPYNIKKF